MSESDTMNITNILYAPDYDLQMDNNISRFFFLNNKHLFIFNGEMLIQLFSSNS